MYGTLLSPLLIVAGFKPLHVVPSILVSQAIGGFSASMFHNRLKNAIFNLTSRDSKVVFIVTSVGVLMTFVAVSIAVVIPTVFLKLYIGLLVISMGILIIARKRFRFSWKKIGLIGVISSFNKGLSGGGFGPIVTCGQVAVGRNPKESVGATTLAEAPICIAAFLIYVLRGVSLNFGLIIPMCLGAAAAGPLGAYATWKYPKRFMASATGVLALVLGVWTLFKTLTSL
ncbi:MAG: TSUP family transporter [Candidatus Bathyarchaeia archaeon]